MAVMVVQPDAIKNQTVPSTATAVRFVQCLILSATVFSNACRAQ